MNDDIKKQTRSQKSSERTLRSMITSLIGRISSSNTRRANAIAMSGVEYRDMRIITPYGVAYVPSDKSEVQIINNNGVQTVVGVYDPNRPTDIQPGEIVLYAGECQIRISDSGIVARKGDINITII